MAARHKMTVSVRPTNPRASTAERRAARVAVLANEQAELKREAAERRLARQDTDSPAVPSAARHRGRKAR